MTAWPCNSAQGSSVESVLSVLYFRPAAFSQAREWQPKTSSRNHETNDFSADRLFDSSYARGHWLGDAGRKQLAFQLLKLRQHCSKTIQ
jgi:hypothetical protein